MLVQHLVVVALCTAFHFLEVIGGRKDLRIHTLVPQQSENNVIYHSDAIIPAAIMAVDDINSNPEYLPDYNLTITFSDSQCQASKGTLQVIKSILATSDDDATKIITFLGGACSTVSEPTAALTGRLYKVVQISYASSSPLLSDRFTYPLFFRTYPSENSFNNGHFALMNVYGWCNVAAVHETANIFSLAVQDFSDRFVTALNNTNLSACIDKDNDGLFVFSFTDSPEIPLSQIVKRDTRIIFGYFYEDKAVVVMCYAKHMGLTSNNHLWILPGWYSNEWWIAADSTDWSQYKYNCTSQDIIEAIEYSIVVDFYTYPSNPDATSISGYTNATFQAKYKTYLEDFIASDLNLANDATITVAYETITYDAVWAIATALNKTENVLRKDGYSLADFEYYSASQNGEVEVEEANRMNTMITNNFTSFMSKINFQGVSGNVQFDENGTRIGNFVFYQMRCSSTNKLQKVQIALYNFDTDGFNITFDLEPEWRTGPPTDRSTPVNVVLNQTKIYSMDVIIGIGIIIAVVLLIFNTVTIMKPLIANSAPYINTIIIIGCIIMMSTCILLGIDSGTPAVVNGDIDLRMIPQSAQDRYSSICLIRLWFLTIGFTLSFGALFGKTWQVYRVYTYPKLKDKPFKHWNFLTIMGVQLFFDLLFLCIWTGLYPLQRSIKQDESNNTVKIYEYCHCENFGEFLGTLYVYKGLLVIFGLFLAYESRNVKYFYINDSRFVSIAMYIVAISTGICALLSLALSQEFFINAGYSVTVLMIVFSCLSCLLILYIPKFYYLVKGIDPIIVHKAINTVALVDNLQLGNTEEIDLHCDKDLKEQVEQENYELKELQKRRFSDQDSGVLTSDEPREVSNSELLTVEDSSNAESPTTDHSSNSESHNSAVTAHTTEDSNPESQTTSVTVQCTYSITVEAAITHQQLKHNAYSDEEDLLFDNGRNEEMKELKIEDEKGKKSENANTRKDGEETESSSGVCIIAPS